MSNWVNGLRIAVPRLAKSNFLLFYFFSLVPVFGYFYILCKRKNKKKKYDENQNPTWIQWKNGKRSTHNGIMEWWRTQMGIWRGKFVVVECSLYARDYYGKSNLDKLLPKYISHIAHSPLICHRPCRSHIFFPSGVCFFPSLFLDFIEKFFFSSHFQQKFENIWKLYDDFMRTILNIVFRGYYPTS